MINNSLHIIEPSTFKFLKTITPFLNVFSLIQKQWISPKKSQQSFKPKFVINFFQIKFDGNNIEVFREMKVFRIKYFLWINNYACMIADETYGFESPIAITSFSPLRVINFCQ